MAFRKGQYPSPDEVASGMFCCYGPLRRKNHNGIKRIAALILPLACLNPAERGCDPLERSAGSPRPIGNHLKKTALRCRSINHSFTPAWKCWDEEENREEYQCPPLECPLSRSPR